MPAPYMVKIAGVTFEGRQEILSGLFDAQESSAQGHGPMLAATLEREPQNQFDSNAIKVVVDGKHIGYVPKYLAAKLAPRMDAGEAYAVTSVEIGGGSDGYSYGVTITIDVATREAV